MKMRTASSPLGNVAIFRRSSTAIDHIVNHMLTSPESKCWILEAPQVTHAVDLASPSARYRAAGGLIDGAEPVTECLYSAYANAICRAVADASDLGWYLRLDDSWLALGSSGLLVVVESDAVVTAFFPGQGNGQRVAASQRSTETRNPLPREFRCSPWPRQRRHRMPTREQRMRTRRMRRWTDEQWLYYGVFRPAVQFIQHKDTRYSPIRSVLPQMSRLRLSHWQEIRERCCRHGD